MMEKVRIDKWLWAARFFKTRSLAKQAIEGGKVRVDGQRIKASKEVRIGDQLVIRQGWDEREVCIEALSEQRRGAPQAAALYRETPQSIDNRARRQAERQALGAVHLPPQQRPTKKQRRQIHRFRDQTREFDKP